MLRESTDYSKSKVLYLHMRFEALCSHGVKFVWLGCRYNSQAWRAAMAAKYRVHTPDNK